MENPKKVAKHRAKRRRKTRTSAKKKKKKKRWIRGKEGIEENGIFKKFVRKM